MADSTQLERLLSVLALPGVGERVVQGAADEAFADVELRLGRSLPEEFKALYGGVGGGSFVGGDLTLLPLVETAEGEESYSVVAMADQYREWEWPIPHEVVVFASDGGGSPLGLWLPGELDRYRPVVVHIGEDFDDESAAAIVGEDIVSFLTGWLAYYVVVWGDSVDPAEALKLLEVPEGLRTHRDDDDDATFEAVMAWANPGLPRPLPDPYERPMSLRQIRRFSLRG